MVYSDYSLKKICIPLNCSWSDKTPYASKEDSEYWLISFGEVYRYFLYISQNKNLFQILG